MFFVNYRDNNHIHFTVVNSLSELNDIRDRFKNVIFEPIF